MKTITLKDLMGMPLFPATVARILTEAAEQAGIQGAERDRLAFITSLGLVTGSVKELPEAWQGAADALQEAVDAPGDEEGGEGTRFNLGHMYLEDVTITTTQGNVVNLRFMLLDPAQIIGISYGVLGVTAG